MCYIDFRNLCDHIIDQSSDWFDPDDVKQGDLVFLNLWYLDWFQDSVHDKIKFPYILVSGDVNAMKPPLSIKNLLHDPKVAAWFCRNMAFTYHPKLFQIPMGQDLTFWTSKFNAKDELVEAYAKGPTPKKHLLYMCHQPRELGDREKIVKMYEKEPHCFSRNQSDKKWEMTPRSVFYEDLFASYFVLSPIGLEADCVRTWEAFVFDCIPIVEHSFLDQLYDGLPVVKVHDWSGITPEFLEKKYKELRSLPRDRAYFDYWIPVIDRMKKRVKRNELQFSKLDATQFSEKDLQDFRLVLEEESEDRSILFYKGALTSVHPLQFASDPSILTLSVCDPWLNKETFNKFNLYVDDPNFLKHREKIEIVESEANFISLLNENREAPVFVDLTYFRTSLNADPENFRHRLKADIKSLMRKRQLGALICGNMAKDSYVSEVLEMVASESRQTIKTRGDCWFFKRE